MYAGPVNMCMVFSVEMANTKCTYSNYNIINSDFFPKVFFYRIFSGQLSYTSARARIGVRARARARGRFYGVMSEAPSHNTGTKTPYTQFDFFHSVSYMFLYMACIGGSFYFVFSDVPTELTLRPVCVPPHPSSAHPARLTRR